MTEGRRILDRKLPMQGWSREQPGNLHRLPVPTSWASQLPSVSLGFLISETRVSLVTSVMSPNQKGKKIARQANAFVNVLTTELIRWDLGW